MPALNSANNRATGVRRNLFQQHLSRRPTTSSSALVLENRPSDSRLGSDASDIIVRDQNGEFQMGDGPLPQVDDYEASHDDNGEDENDRQQRLKDAIRHHQIDKNRTPSEPAELLDAVKTSLRAKMMALAEDNWRYEAEDESITR